MESGAYVQFHRAHQDLSGDDVPPVRPLLQPVLAVATSAPHAQIRSSVRRVAEPTASRTGAAHGTPTSAVGEAEGRAGYTVASLDDAIGASVEEIRAEFFEDWV